MNDIGPVLVCFGVVLIPITAILTNHQRKMAALIHSKPDSGTIIVGKSDNSELVQEIRQLRSEVAALSIAVDDVRDGSIRSRLEPPVLRH